jgi:ribonuclease P protein component
MSTHILKKPWQFRQVYRNGKKIDCKYAVLFYYRTGEPSEPRFGFVASKRVGNAVCRSRAKRLLRLAAGRTEGLLKHNDVWVVLVARTAILNTKSGDFTREVERTLRDEGLLQ